MKLARPTPRAILLSLLRQLGEDLKGALRSPDDPTAVHDLRVAIRRFTQALRIFKGAAGEGAGEKIRHRLKKVRDSLGEVRNLDIALEILQETGHQGPLWQQFKDGRRSAQDRLVRRLKSVRKQGLLHDWKSAIRKRAGGAKAWEQARLKLAGLAAKFFEDGNDSIRPGVPYHRLHRVRLVGKRFRYTIELFKPHSSGSKRGGEFKVRLRVLKELQDYLGELNDTATVMDLVEGNAAVKNQIHRMLVQREAAYRSFWKQKFNVRAQKSWMKWITNT